MSQYAIPLFQRPYAWKRENWERLWEDLFEYYEADDKKATHFMGALVVQRKTQSGAVALYWTIDGQQRLTTYSLLLCALRDFCQEIDNEEINSYLTNISKQGTSLYLKLALGEADREIYSKVVLGENWKDSAKDSRISCCYEYFRDKLKRVVAETEDGEFDILRFYSVVRDAPQVVLINLEESDDPYVIFESLNFKGVALKNVDLIRNFVLMKFKEEAEQRKVYQEIWRPIEETLEEAAEDFFFHYVRKETKKTTPKTRVYEEIRNIFSRLDESAARAKIREIQKNAEVYREFIDPKLCSNRDIARELIALKEMDCNVTRPLLMRFNELYERQNVSPDEYVRFLRVLTSYVFRRAVCGVTSILGNGLASTLTRGLDEAEHPYDQWLEVVLARQKGKVIWPDDEAFSSAIKQIKRPKYRPELAKLLLGEIERKIAGKEAGDIEAATIEHIMPQTLNEEWRRDLGESADEIRRDYLHSYGNLTLTKFNSELGNASYTKKRKGFEDSGFRLNRDLARKFERWSPEEIEERADFLAAQAVEIWRRPSPSVGNIVVLTFNDDWKHRKPRVFRILSEQRPVKCWTDVYITALSHILRNFGRDDFVYAVKKCGLTNSLLDGSDDGLWRPREIGQRIYVETNLNADTMRKNILKLADFLRLDIKSWRIEL